MVKLKGQKKTFNVLLVKILSKTFSILIDPVSALLAMPFDPILFRALLGTIPDSLTLRTPTQFPLPLVTESAHVGRHAKHSMFRFPTDPIRVFAFKDEILRIAFIPAHVIRENTYAANFNFN